MVKAYGSDRSYHKSFQCYLLKWGDWRGLEPRHRLEELDIVGETGRRARERILEVILRFR